MSGPAEGAAAAFRRRQQLLGRQSRSCQNLELLMDCEVLSLIQSPMKMKKNLPITSIEDEMPKMAVKTSVRPVVMMAPGERISQSMHCTISSSAPSSLDDENAAPPPRTTAAAAAAAAAASSSCSSSTTTTTTATQLDEEKEEGKWKTTSSDGSTKGKKKKTTTEQKKCDKEQKRSPE